MAETRYATELIIPSANRRYVADVTATGVLDAERQFEVTIRNGIVLEDYEGYDAYFTLLDKKNLASGRPTEKFKSWVELKSASTQIVRNDFQNAIVILQPFRMAASPPDTIGMDLIVLSKSTEKQRHPFNDEVAATADMTVRYSTLCLDCGLTRNAHVEPMPKPPKFSSIAEADAWMAKYEDAAVGSIDEVLGKGSIHV